MSFQIANYERLRDRAFSLGMSLFGVADITDMRGEFQDLSPETVESVDKGISMAVRLSDGVLGDIVDHPTRLYLHHYRQVNYLLDRAALAVASLVQEMGGRAVPIGASQTIDWEKQRGHVSHREVAQRAGLGWRGRNNLLVTPQWGSRVRLVTVLTDLPLKFDSPLEKECGACRACISACPCGAIAETREEFDYGKCYEQLKAFKNKLNLGHYICGVCVKMCGGRRTEANNS